MTGHRNCKVGNPDAAATNASASVTVHALPKSEARPAHWVDDKHAVFQNPWPSFKMDMGPTKMLPMMYEAITGSPSTAPAKTGITIRKPTWGLDAADGAPAKGVKATWLGHACFFVELDNGAKILFDPVFSDRCSPSQWMGPKRFTAAPCAIEDIPTPDAIVISHNHYDHMDTHTITTLFKKSAVMPHIFAPLGNEGYFKSLGIPETHYHTLDWWQNAEVGLSDAAFTLTCTPAQHMAARGLLDRMHSLWSSWMVTFQRDDKPTHVYFAGDTGYRSVANEAEEATAPVCPAFKEIGERFGEVEFAMIPIGAYQPRWFMSPMHCAPQDSVRVFQDVRVKKALGMHWGTWVLTVEEVLEPPKKLKEECAKLGIAEDRFTVCDIGETRVF
ncbi:Metallo-hydrolase/oxidoreductase [Cylindrobasidium torrendii FP15055 ss-10]|uniref:Metallo-hydrolase/oxidoreductase n=1 Tax=Cylindrobasidium torrendii FP15055 ss-10 TaxID=1314674 RepID=A0A0D7BD31_9AGAR|nr:Metallo-hydrolase/oxidoreductase [Cylindrobasidium torrendii FP15055 ss-10]